MKFELLKNQALNKYTTLQVGGVADLLAVVKSEEELGAALWFAKEQTATPPFILGGGSNILCSDDGFRGVVIKMALEGIGYEVKDGKTLVTASAGESWDKLVDASIEKGLQGLENLSGIPGTVGAAPIQNINAYGSTVADYIHSVSVVDSQTLENKQLTNAECLFGYRDSLFKQPAGKNLVVTAVTFALSSVGTAKLSYRSSSQSIANYLKEKNIDTPTAKDIREAVLHARSNIGMLAGQFRSAGSFFKNVVVSSSQFSQILQKVEAEFPDLNKKFSPWHWSLPNGEEKIATAFLLECSPYNKSTYGVKRINNVGFSPKHSLSIVTEPGATAKDVEHFSQLVTDSVKEIFSVELEREVLSV